MATNKTDTASGGGEIPAPAKLGSKTVTARPLGNLPQRERSVTYEDKTVEHWIPDAELDQLSELRKDNVVEIFWGTLGVFLGSVVAAIEKLPKIGSPTNPLQLGDLATLLICCVSLILTGIMGFFWYNRSTRAQDLVATIRARKKFRVNEHG